MADKKISELPVATAPTGTELAEIVQGGVNKQTTLQDIANLGGGGSVTSVSGTSNRITSTGGANPVIDIDAAYDATIAAKSPKVFVISVTDDVIPITTGIAKITFRMPFAMTVTAVRASLTVAQASGTILTVDINEGGVTILSTKLTVDNTETTSTTAVTPPVISDTSLADDAVITIDVDQIGDGTATGLKVYLIA